MQAEDATVERWKSQIDESAAALQKGNHTASLQISNRLIGEMINRLGPGQGSTEIFGLVLTHKALASAGLGRNEDALWHWHTVLTLYPTFGKRDLSSYGNAGRFLMDNRQVRKPSDFDPRKAGKKPANVKPPRVKTRVEPTFPAGARAFGAGGVLAVEVIITPEGRVVAPIIVKPLPAPTLSYVALDAVRRWRFEPAMIDGKAEPVIFTLTVNYKP
jgi:TonB family protein